MTMIVQQAQPLQANGVSIEETQSGQLEDGTQALTGLAGGADGSAAGSGDHSATASGDGSTLLADHKGKLAIGVAATLGLMVFYSWREKRLAKTDPEEYARLQRIKAVMRGSDRAASRRGARKSAVSSASAAPDGAAALPDGTAGVPDGTNAVPDATQSMSPVPDTRASQPDGAGPSTPGSTR